jgi:hypothetical protein
MLCCKPHLCRRLPRIADVSSAQAAKLLSFTELRSVSTRGRVESYCRGLPQDCRRLVCTSSEAAFFYGASFRFDTGTCRILMQRSPQDCRRLVCTSSEAAFFSGASFRFDTGTCRILLRTSPQDCRRLVCISSEAAFFSGTSFRFDTGRVESYPGFHACKATQSLIFCSERCSLSTRDVSNPESLTPGPADTPRESRLRVVYLLPSQNLAFW